MDLHAYPSIPNLCSQIARRRSPIGDQESLLERLFQAVVKEAWSQAIPVIKALSEDRTGNVPPAITTRSRRLLRAIRNPSGAGPTYADLSALLQECREVLLSEEDQPTLAFRSRLADKAA